MEPSVREIDHLSPLRTSDRAPTSGENLRQVLAPRRADDSVYIPPALPANRRPCKILAPDVSAGASSRVHDLSRTKSTGQGAQKEGRCDHCKLPLWWSNSSDVHRTVEDLPKAAADGSKLKGNDILISHYTGGQKEAMKAIVQRKVLTGPKGKYVEAQLLVKSSFDDKESFTLGARETNFCPNTVMTAAATASAIAATAPLLKAQCDLGAKIATVTELVTKLQEMDQQVKHMAEHQAKVSTQDPKSKNHKERVRELEAQLSMLSNQRLSHLEKIQERQLELQSQMFTSAFTTNRIHPGGALPEHSDTLLQSSATCTAARTLSQGLQQLPGNNNKHVSLRNVPSDISTATQAYQSCPGAFGTGSSLQTPAPRKSAPVPMSKDVHVQQKMRSAVQKAKASARISASGQGERNFLEDILNNQENPTSETHDVEKTNVAMTTASRYPERSSSSNPLTESFTTFVDASRGSGSAACKASAVAQRATDVLRDLGGLNGEMHGILQLKQPTLSAKGTDSRCSQKPSLIESVKAPKSMFEDAERILREVQLNKKFIEGNLEAIVRAKDSASLYSVIDSLTANSDEAEKIRIGKTVDAWITVIDKDIQGEIARKNFLQSKSRQQELSVTRKGYDVKAIKFNKDMKDKMQNKPESTASRFISTIRSGQKQFEDDCGNRNQRSNTTQSSQQKEQKSKISVDEFISTTPVLQGEDYLRKVYGKALYQGHRSTYKKGPYLRVNSPLPKSKAHRPKIIENIKGVKVKSARTQTIPSALKADVSPPVGQQQLSAPHFHNNQYLFSPSHQITSTSVISGPVEGHLVPMAVALGMPRMDNGVPQPADLIISRSHPTTVITSVPSSPRKSQPKVKKPNIAVMHMKSEKKEPVKLTVQVLPNMDIDSLPSISPAASQRSASPELQQVMQQFTPALKQSPEQSEEEDGTGFPGTNYIAVADLPKDPDTDTEYQGSPEPAIELEGFAESISALYKDPSFPPSVPAPHPVVDIVGVIERKESIENQLIEWVEQELMSRIISKMCPVQPVEHVIYSESEESVLSGSDIVEAAGGGGLQLFVDAGIPVDSQLVRQFVDEALAEIIAIMLGQRQSESKTLVQEPPQQRTPSPIMLIPTPVPTPRQTPSPPARNATLIQTPELTPQGSVENESESEPELEPFVKSPLNDVGLKPVEKSSPVVTPVITPTPTHSRVSTPSPITQPISKTSSAPSQTPPNPWGDAELPLEEENPSPAQDAAPRPRAIIMSVANDEEPENLILPPPLSTAPVIPPMHVQTPAPHCPSETPSASTEESSSTISATETETADRNISEGEILLSYGQVAAAKALAEGGIFLPNFNDTLSSTLLDTQEMDEDPPSVGQVISKSRKGLHKYSIGTMLSKVGQCPFAPQEVHHPENSDDDSSTGQISEGQMPRLTKTAESILIGLPPIIKPLTMDGDINLPRTRRSPSPGQLHVQTERNGRESEASHGPLTLGDLEICTGSALQTRHVIVAPQKTPVTGDRGQGDDIALMEQKPAAARVIQVESRTKDFRPGTEVERSSGPPAGPLKMSVTLPSMNEEDQSGSISTLDGDDTSGAEIF
ncbi:protein TALPID3 isoform X3 [Amblyraja radiata]|uniref:protein TALPID3 isoform X3 n=1 Tax=Amblyraja radiata TaxID=386614 RepID=UPI0014025572|nr:protein TALPID3 isoform X3 [Amblyraja radiata]